MSAILHTDMYCCDRRFWAKAARFEGDHGSPPNDIDVLIIGDPDFNDIAQTAQKSSTKLRIDVNRTMQTHTWWANKSGSKFRKEIGSRLLVELEVWGVNKVRKKSR